MVQFLSEHVDDLCEDDQEALTRLLSRFRGETIAERAANAMRKLKKPEKPNVMRWNTLSEIILFTPLFFEAIQHALEAERFNCGSNAPAGSIAAMCTQWLKWSGSPKLCALLAMAVEFVTELWQPADKEIALPDLDYGVPGCFKTFSRPRRVLKVLLTIEGILEDLEARSSFETVVAAFADEGREEVVKLFKHMYSLARESVLRNSSRYLSGVLLFGALADPAFAPFVFEAFGHWKKLKRRPPLRTTQGKRLEKFLKES
jgi:hypothetical protein